MSIKVSGVKWKETVEIIPYKGMLRFSFCLFLLFISSCSTMPNNQNQLAPCEYQNQNFPSEYCVQTIVLEKAPSIAGMFGESQTRKLSVVGKFLLAHRESIVHVEAHNFMNSSDEAGLKRAEEIANFAIEQMLHQGVRRRQMVPIAFASEQGEFKPQSDPRNHRLKIVFLTYPAPRSQSEGDDVLPPD